MPSFYDMKEHYESHPSIIGHQLKKMANDSINEIFENSTTYRKGMIYDCNLNTIEEMEFRFLKTKTYTLEKDAVEYMVMFRPLVNPEIDFDESEDQKHRFGYYIDIYDDNTKLTEKWLIVGKDSSEFDKYNVLKCNWEFEWIDKERTYHKTLGCMRDRNNYNSGVWSRDGYTTVENQTAFIVPSNSDTDTIDYDVRFMITDNTVHPKTYRATKLMDTFPLGTIKVTLGQSHYNEHTDLCEKKLLREIGDTEETMHMICDYYKSALPPLLPETDNSVWNIETTIDKIRSKIDEIQIKAVLDSTTITSCIWTIKINNVKYDVADLSSYIEFKNVETNYGNNTNVVSIRVINDVLIGYIITLYTNYDDINGSYDDYIEMEVIDG